LRVERGEQGCARRIDWWSGNVSVMGWCFRFNFLE
jgi:hypothetical protein